LEDYENYAGNSVYFMVPLRQKGTKTIKEVSIVGLFFGKSKKEREAEEAERRRQEEIAKDPRKAPLMIGSLYAIGNDGMIQANDEYGFIIRDLAEKAAANNNMIYKMLQIVKQLREENKEMRERLEKIEVERSLDGASRKEKEIVLPKARAM